MSTIAEIPFYKPFTAVQVISSVVMVITVVALGYLIATHWPLSSMTINLHNTLLFGVPGGTGFVSLLTLGVFTYLKSRLKPLEPKKEEKLPQIQVISSTPSFKSDPSNEDSNKTDQKGDTTVVEVEVKEDKTPTHEETTNISPSESKAFPDDSTKPDKKENETVFENIEPAKVLEISLPVLSANHKEEFSNENPAPIVNETTSNSTILETKEPELVPSIVESILERVFAQLDNNRFFAKADSELPTEFPEVEKNFVPPSKQDTVQEDSSNITQTEHIEKPSRSTQIKKPENIKFTFFEVISSKIDAKEKKNSVMTIVDLSINTNEIHEDLDKQISNKVSNDPLDSSAASSTLVNDQLSNIVDDKTNEQPDNKVTSETAVTVTISPAVQVIEVAEEVPLTPTQRLEHVQNYLKFIEPIFKDLSNLVMGIYLHHSIYLKTTLNPPKQNNPPTKDENKLSQNFSLKCEKLKTESKIGELKAHFSQLWIILSSEIVKILKISEFVNNVPLFEAFRKQFLDAFDDKIADYYFTSDFIDNYCEETFTKATPSFYKLGAYLNNKCTFKEIENNYLQFVFDDISACSGMAFLNFQRCLTQLNFTIGLNKKINIQTIQELIEAGADTYLTNALPKCFDPFLRQLKKYRSALLKNDKSLPDVQQELYTHLYKCALKGASKEEKKTLLQSFFRQNFNPNQFSEHSDTKFINSLVENGQAITHFSTMNQAINKEGYNDLEDIFTSLLAFFDPAMTSNSIETLIDISKKNAKFKDLAEVEKQLSLKCEEPIKLVSGEQKSPHTKALDIYQKHYKEQLQKGYVPLTPISAKGLDLVTLKFYQGSFTAGVISKGLFFVSVKTIVDILNNYFNFNLSAKLGFLKFSKHSQDSLFNTIVNIISITMGTIKDVTLSNHLAFGKNFSDLIAEQFQPFLTSLKKDQTEIKSQVQIQEIFCKLFQESLEKMDPLNLLA